MIRLRGGWRQFRRVIPPPDAPIRVEVEALPDLVLETGDISEGGMELQLAGPPPMRVGGELILVLRLPGEAVIRVVARVRHMDRTRIGVVFADHPPSGREAIRRWWQRLRELWQD